MRARVGALPCLGHRGIAATFPPSFEEVELQLRSFFRCLERGGLRLLEEDLFVLVCFECFNAFDPLIYCTDLLRKV